MRLNAWATVGLTAPPAPALKPTHRGVLRSANPLDIWRTKVGIETPLGWVDAFAADTRTRRLPFAAGPQPSRNSLW